MAGEGSRWTGLVAAGCFTGAIVTVVLALLLAVGLVREYGPAEGYGNVLLQTLPIIAVGLAVAALLTWAGIRLNRRSRRGH